jgi:hypothetical protein
VLVQRQAWQIAGFAQCSQPQGALARFLSLTQYLLEYLLHFGLELIPESAREQREQKGVQAGKR